MPSCDKAPPSHANPMPPVRITFHVTLRPAQCIKMMRSYECMCLVSCRMPGFKLVEADAILKLMGMGCVTVEEMAAFPCKELGCASGFSADF